MEPNDRPEWLPEGWTMRAVRRKTGKIGVIDRYYTSQASGNTCRSKLEVMRYLNNEKKAGHTTKSMPSFGKKKQRYARRVENFPEWLPSEWILEIRRKCNGSEYKCYIDPSTGCRFYSKYKIYLHLESKKLLNPMTDQMGRNKTNSTPEICISTSQKGSIRNKFTDNQIQCSPDGLPHGWIKEVKVRKTNYGARKKELYYTEPISGRAFCSLMAAHRYIESGEASKHTARPKKRRMTDMPSSEKESPPPTRAKKRGAMRSLFSSPKRNSNVNTAVAKIDEKQLAREDNYPSELIDENLPQPKSRNKAITMATRSSKRLAGLDADPPPINSGNSSGSRPRRAVAKRPMHRAGDPGKSEGINQTSGRFNELKPTTVDESKEQLPCRTEVRISRDESLETPLILPFGDSWLDPCIKFAFETLMSDIPMDPAAIQQLLSGQDPPSLSDSSYGIGTKVKADSS